MEGMLMRDSTLNIRTTATIKNLLQQAADMLGTTVSGFLLSSATEKAHEIIQHQRHFSLTDEQWNVFCEILDRKPIKNEKLQSLLISGTVFKDA